MPSASVHDARTLYRVSVTLLPCRRLITSPDRRLNVDQIKHHPFFYGVDWAAIRTIEAPFIPRLRSITDTSYFPTDELEQVPDEPVGADTTGANKDLAFLGYVLVLLSVLHFSDNRPGLVYALQVHVQAVHDIVARILISAGRPVSVESSCNLPAVHVDSLSSAVELSPFVGVVTYLTRSFIHHVTARFITHHTFVHECS